MMQEEFEMDMIGKLKFFLGLQIKHEKDAIYIHQIKYIKELLKKFNMDDAKEMKTSMHPITRLRQDTKVENTLYYQMIGLLLYLTLSRPDIMFNVCLCA